MDSDTDIQRERINYSMKTDLIPFLVFVAYSWCRCCVCLYTVNVSYLIKSSSIDRERQQNKQEPILFHLSYGKGALLSSSFSYSVTSNIVSYYVDKISMNLFFPCFDCVMVGSSGWMNAYLLKCAFCLFKTFNLFRFHFGLEDTTPLYYPISENLWTY